MKHPAQIFFSQAHPTFAIFETEFIKTTPELLVIRFVAQEEFVENANSGELHSGFCTLLLDSVMGGAVMGSLGKLQPIATINLTTQHSCRPLLGDKVICSGKVERIEQEIAIVSGQLICDRTKKTHATALGSFMIGTRGIPLNNKREKV